MIGLLSEDMDQLQRERACLNLSYVDFVEHSPTHTHFGKMQACANEMLLLDKAITNQSSGRAGRRREKSILTASTAASSWRDQIITISGDMMSGRAGE